MASSSSPEWSRLVSRFRWLRETLVSCGAGLATPLGLAAASSGADAALRARDWGEFLKSVSYLASDGVVVAAAAAAAGATTSWPPPTSPPPSSSSAPSSSPSSSSCSSLYAPHEADALLLLYFSCVPPQPQSLDVATRLRALAMRRRRRESAEEGGEDSRQGGDRGEEDENPSLSHPLPQPIDLSVAVHVAMTTGDGLALARLFRDHPARSWRTRALMAPALERGLWSASPAAPASSSPPSGAAAASPPPPPPSPPLPVRGGYPAALAALAASYRSLPAAVALRLILSSGSSGEEEGGGGGGGGGRGEELLEELVAAARGRGDRWALVSAELPATGELKFK